MPYAYIDAGATSGAPLLTREPIVASGQHWYVSSLTGSDAVSPRGLDRIRPLATLAQAHTNATAGDTIILLENHSETLSSAQTFNKAGIRVRSEGSGNTRARFTASAAINMFDVTAAGVWFENVYFPASTAAATARIRIATAGTRIYGCYFQCGASDTSAAVKYITGAGQAEIRSTSFVSSATSVSAQPAIGVEVVNAMSDLNLDTVVFDGGSYGWSDYAFKGTAAITRLYGIDLSLLNDSDLYLATSSVYEIHVANQSGSARMVLP